MGKSPVLSPTKKREIARLFNSKKFTSIQLAKRFQIKATLVRKYGKIGRADGQFHLVEGRPRKIDPMFYDELLSVTNRKGALCDDTEFEGKVKECIEKTAELRNQPAHKLKIEDKRTFKLLKESVGVVERGAETGTKARLEAVESKRTMMSFAAMAKYAEKVCKGSGRLLCNADGSVCTTGFKLDSKSVALVPGLHKTGGCLV